ncbi:uncharacterized protein LOC124275599 [Haliotis rubra]|uniref:uncharacterized protein LOC124275599 n=1 Tax=Haliotis rubra TaxID=36100 RepID=UPI001EE52606|nr:uncharacterized protein LOC124275599 [Haliotis rubra]
MARKEHTVSSLPSMAVNLLIFLTWTVTAFICHKSAALYLRQAHDHVHGVLAVSITQVILCISVFKIRRKTASEDRNHTLPIVLYHVTATFLTNNSLSLIPASSTIAVRMLEPITSAVIQCVIQEYRPEMTVMISLAFVGLGGVMFIWDPLQDGALFGGVLVALMSNLALGLRNIFLKNGFTRGSSIVPRNPKRTASVLIVTVVCIGISMLVCQKDVLLRTVLLTTTAIFHSLYTYCSVTMVLKRVSVVSHAVINIFKRVTVVLLLCVAGQRYVTTFNLIGLTTASLGSAVYSFRGRVQDVTGKNINFVCQQNFTYLVTAFTCLLLIFQVRTPLSRATMEEGSINNPRVYPNISPHVQNQPSVFEFFNESPVTLVQNIQPGAREKLQRTVFKQRVSNVLHIGNASDKRRILYGPSWNTALLDKQWNNNIYRQVSSMSTFENVISKSRDIQTDIFRRLIGRYDYVVLTDLAVHENKGDASISAGELLLVKDLGKEVIFYCSTYACSDANLMAGREKALLYGVQNVAVLCHGGGNMIAYRDSDILRGKVFEIFRGFEIFVMPQSIWINPRHLDKTHLHDTEKVYARHPRVTLLLRDVYSLRLATKHFPQTRCLLVPDSAFQIGSVPRYLQPSYDILWMARNDIESAHYKIPKFPSNVSVTARDWRKWLTAKGTTSTENMFLVAVNGFTFLQRGRVVVTDRLHGHIMSTLLHVPHVLLDTVDGKVAKYHNTWTRGLEGKTVLTATSGTDAMHKAMFLLKKFANVLPSIDPIMKVKETIV